MTRHEFNIPVYVISIDLAEKGVDKTVVITFIMKNNKPDFNYMLIDNRVKND